MSQDLEEATASTAIASISSASGDQHDSSTTLSQQATAKSGLVDYSSDVENMEADLFEGEKGEEESAAVAAREDVEIAEEGAKVAQPNEATPTRQRTQQAVTEDVVMQEQEETPVASSPTKTATPTATRLLPSSSYVSNFSPGPSSNPFTFNLPSSSYPTQSALGSQRQVSPDTSPSRKTASPRSSLVGPSMCQGSLHHDSSSPDPLAIVPRSAHSSRAGSVRARSRSASVALESVSAQKKLKQKVPAKKAATSKALASAATRPAVLEEKEDEPVAVVSSEDLDHLSESSGSRGDDKKSGRGLELDTAVDAATTPQAKTKKAPAAFSNTSSKEASPVAPNSRAQSKKPRGSGASQVRFTSGNENIDSVDLTGISEDEDDAKTEIAGPRSDPLPPPPRSPLPSTQSTSEFPQPASSPKHPSPEVESAPRASPKRPRRSTAAPVTMGETSDFSDVASGDEGSEDEDEVKPKKKKVNTPKLSLMEQAKQKALAAVGGTSKDKGKGKAKAKPKVKEPVKARAKLGTSRPVASSRVVSTTAGKKGNEKDEDVEKEEELEIIVKEVNRPSSSALLKAPKSSSARSAPTKIKAMLMAEGVALPETAEDRQRDWALKSMDTLVWCFVESGDLSFWWPGNIKNEVRSERPIRIELLLDPKQTILNFTSRIIVVEEPSSSSILSFRTPSGQFRFGDSTFVSSSADGASSGILSPETFNKTLYKAYKIEDRRESGEPSDVDGDEKFESSDDEEIEIEDAPKAGGTASDDELLREESSIDMDFPIRGIGYAMRTYWPGLAVAYHPPKGNAKYGSYQVDWTSGTTSLVRVNQFLVPTNPDFYKVAIGEQKLEVPKRFYEELSAFFSREDTRSTLQRVIANEFEPAKTWNESFFAGGARREMLTKLSRFGELEADHLERIAGDLKEWAIPTTGQARPVGSAEYEASSEPVRVLYVATVLLPLAVVLYTVDEHEFSQEAAKELEADGKTPTDNEIAALAFSKGYHMLDVGSLQKWIHGLRNVRATAAGLASSQAEVEAKANQKEKPKANGKGKAKAKAKPKPKKLAPAPSKSRAKKMSDDEDEW